MWRNKTPVLICFGLLLSAAPFSEPSAAADPAAAQLSIPAQRYNKWFNDAAAEFNVPAEVLQAIAFAETRWLPRVPKGLAKKNTDEYVVEFDPATADRPPVYGIMGLRDDDYFGHSLQEAARLIGQTPETLKADTQQNIRGAAAYLASLGNGKSRDTAFADWEDAIAKYSGIPQRDVAQIYSYEVLNNIRLGQDSPRFRINQRAVDLEKAYGRSRLNTLSAPVVTLPLDGQPAR